MKSSILLSLAALAAHVVALPTQAEERSVTLPMGNMNLAPRVDVRPKLRRGKNNDNQQGNNQQAENGTS